MYKLTEILKLLEKWGFKEEQLNYPYYLENNDNYLIIGNLLNSNEWQIRKELEKKIEYYIIFFFLKDSVCLIDYILVDFNLLTIEEKDSLMNCIKFIEGKYPNRRRFSELDVLNFIDLEKNYEMLNDLEEILNFSIFDFFNKEFLYWFNINWKNKEIVCFYIVEETNKEKILLLENKPKIIGTMKNLKGEIKYYCLEPIKIILNKLEYKDIFNIIVLFEICLKEKDKNNVLNLENSIFSKELLEKIKKEYNLIEKNIEIRSLEEELVIIKQIKDNIVFSFLIKNLLSHLNIEYIRTRKLWEDRKKKVKKD